MPHNFWMINCNNQNFDITRKLGFAQQGLKAEYRRKVQRVEPGDRIIYYVSGERVFTATATVTKGYEEVRSTPWINEGKTAWPYRVGIKPDVILSHEQYIDAGLIAYRLEYLRKWPPEDWHMAFQGNLHLLSMQGRLFSRAPRPAAERTHAGAGGPEKRRTVLETEMLKLRDGREFALRQVDAELAAEAERSNVHRERRRPNAERDPARPARPQNAHTPEPAGQKSEEPSLADQESTATASEQSPPGGSRSNPRGRRTQGRGRNRQTTPNTTKFDDG